MVRLNDTSDEKKQIGYLNPAMISQSALNPTINKDDPKFWSNKGKTFNKKLFDLEQKQQTRLNRSCATTYIARAMYAWKDREAIFGAYHFKYVYSL
jgi:hypothetical protein